MKIFLSVGHSVLENGNTTSANGVINEYQYCKQLGVISANYLRQMGHEVNLVICPERQFNKSTEEKGYKLAIENAGNYDLACELHLNASDNTSASGSEVYYKSSRGQIYAERVNSKLAEVFRNRGTKKRDNLYMLNQTNAPAILIECFFCTSQEDCNKGSDMDLVARKIAEGITGSRVSTAPPTPQAIQQIDPLRPNLAQGGNPHLYDLQGAFKELDCICDTTGLWVGNIVGHAHNISIDYKSRTKYSHVVAWVQCRIGAKIDGDFYEKTTDKVNDYRVAHGMPANGIIDESLIKTILRCECGVEVY